MKKSNLIHARTCVYNVNYHIVWSVKYRRKVLNAEVEAYMRDMTKDLRLRSLKLVSVTMFICLCPHRQRFLFH